MPRRKPAACAVTVTRVSHARPRLMPWLSFLLGILLALQLPAHEGEVHDDFPAAVAGHALEPRFATAGESAEVVGVLHGGQLWLYVSRFATNAPWSGLRIEVERDGKDVPAEPVSEGIYRVAAGGLQRGGRHAVVLSLQDEELDELLTAQLVVDNAPGQDAGQPRALMSAGGMLLVAAVVVHLLHGWRVKRRREREPGR